MEKLSTKIYDLSDYPISERNGTYGGNSGDKESILINGSHWIIKYPTTTDGMERIGSLSYTASPLSEYIGSQIFSLLSYDVHETRLGYRNGKIVVACKDFCNDDERLIEYRQLRNTYSDDVKKALSNSGSSTGNKHFSDLNEIMVHLKYNPMMKNVVGIKERFWETAVIDTLINNNDRNNGNWGIIKSKSTVSLAPIYDNAGSFSPKVPDSKLENRLKNKQSLADAVNGNVTAYSIDGEHNLFIRDFLKLNIKELHDAIVKLTPIIESRLEDIQAFISGIPEGCEGLGLMSEIRKKEYIAEMMYRYEMLLLPQYEECRKMYQDTFEK